MGIDFWLLFDAPFRPLVLIPISIVIGLVLRSWRIPLAVVVASSASTLIKALVDRPRPLDPLVITHDAAFPSGHATATAAFCFAIAFYCRKPWGYWVAATVTALVCVSRVMLRVHWPSDVFAGAALGLVVAFAASSYRANR